MKSINHIAILCPGFASSETDDSCIPPLQSYIRQLQGTYKHITISIIAFQYPFLNDSYTWCDTTVYPMNGRNKKFPSRLLTWNKCLQQFKKIMNQKQVDHIHSFWLSECALLGTQLSKKYSIPHTISIMGQDALASNKYLNRINLRKSKVVALSEFHAQAYQNVTAKKVHQVIPMGIQTDEFTTEALPITFDILGVGALTPLKNYTSFLNIIQALIKNQPNLKAAIVGSGQELSLLKNLITTKGLEKHVQLLGQLSRKEVLKCMKQSNILLHTSQYESLGYVYLEALASDCKVVSYPVGWAATSKDCFLGKDETELTKLTLQLLGASPEHQKPQIPKIEDTVNQYFNLYSETVD